MKKTYQLLTGLILLLSYQTGTAQSKTIDPTELEVLKKVIKSDTIPTVYFKTIISDLNQPLSRQLFYLSEFDICNSLVDLDSASLNNEERRYIVERFSSMESKNINKLIRDPKNFSLKQLKGHNWLQISMPVVFRDGEFAIYYSKGAYSGQFTLMKKIDGYWRDVCYSAVWSE